MSDKPISINNAPKPVGLYPHARRVGNLLFLSGVGPRVAGSNESDRILLLLRYLRCKSL